MPTVSSGPPPSSQAQPRHKVLNRTSVGLVTAFLLCLAIFIVLGLKGRRPAHLFARAQAPTPSRTRKHIERDRPKLWEVRPDNRAFRRPGEAVGDWQPIAAWTDEKRQTPQATPVPGIDHLIGHHVAMGQAWCHASYPFSPESTIHLPAPLRPPAPPVVSDPRALNVAFLVAMPSPRPETHPAPRHHKAVTRLLYEDGQLLMGVTSLPCEEQVMPYIQH